jgi:fumarylacetoacetase
MRSFLDIPSDSPFPLQNLPYGVFAHPERGPTLGVAIGNQILDLALLERQGLLTHPLLKGNDLFQQPTLNRFMAAGRPTWAAARQRITQLLSYDEPTLRDHPQRSHTFFAQDGVRMLMPVEIGDYTDFYSSREHATNVGIMLRGPDNALQPNWLHLPVAYHGRASSVVVSGTDLHRPCGQTKPADAPSPLFGPSKSVDFELELGTFIGPGNRLGKPIPVGEAAEHLFGMVLVNDWSARDIQSWEYVPLGPFLAKNFGTSISPWVVTFDALESFRQDGPAQNPAPLPYLQSTGSWSFDIHLEVYLQTAKMAELHCICRSNAKHLYWNICQQLAHHTINGCNIRPGDLLASGTISGPATDSYGSMMELAWRGSKPIALPNGETRAFLQDGDRITMTAWCQGKNYRVGFGTVTGTVLPPYSP